MVHIKALQNLAFQFSMSSNNCVTTLDILGKIYYFISQDVVPNEADSQGFNKHKSGWAALLGPAAEIRLLFSVPPFEEKEIRRLRNENQQLSWLEVLLTR